MHRQSQKAVRQVLNEAAQHEQFFDLSDAERLAWMIGRGFVLGMSAASGVTPPGAKPDFGSKADLGTGARIARKSKRCRRP